MVLKMFEAEQLVEGSTLVLITSGSAGLSLALIQRALANDCGLNFRVLVLMPKAYEKKAVVQRMLNDHNISKSYDTDNPELACQILFMDGVVSPTLLQVCILKLRAHSAGVFMEVMAEGKAMVKENGYAILDQVPDHRATVVS